MAKRTLAELKARLREDQEKKGKSSTGQFDNDTFPFFNAGFDTEAEFRILEDGNEENDKIFKIDRYMHKLPINGSMRKFPCLRMYGEDCPACDRSRKYYSVAKKNNENTKTKDGELGPNAAIGKIFLANKDEIIRALVIKDPLPVEAGKESHAGKVRTLYLTNQVSERIMADLSSFSDTDPNPWDIEEGVNFIVRKTKNSYGAPSYLGSGFARKSPPIPQEWKDAIKLVDLKTLLPKNPGLENVIAIMEAYDNGTAVPTTHATKVQPVTQKAVEQPHGTAEETVDDDSKIPFEETAPVTETVTETVSPKTAAVVETPKTEVKADADEMDIMEKIKKRRLAQGAKP